MVSEARGGLQVSFRARHRKAVLASCDRLCALVLRNNTALVRIQMLKRYTRAARNTVVRILSKTCLNARTAEEKFWQMTKL